VVASIDPELLEDVIDMEEIDAESVDDCTDESVMEYLESTQARSASITAEYVKAEVLANVSFSMSEKDPALLVTKSVADYYSLHRNLRLDFINGKPNKAVKHLVSVIRPATLSSRGFRGSKLEMDMSELKKDNLEFVKYLEEMAIIHDEHCHVVEQKKTGDSGTKNNGKSSDAGSRSSEHNFGGSSHGGASNKASDRDRTKSGQGRSSESASTGSSRPESRRLASTRRSVRERSTTCLTVRLHTGRRSYRPVVRVQEEERCRQEEGELQNFGQQRSDGGQQR
jgi:hypothetical protein